MGDGMPVVEGDAVLHGLRFGRRIETFTALCRDDKCPWKYRGVTCEATHIKAEEHVGKTGHAATVYEEARTTIEAGRDR